MVDELRRVQRVKLRTETLGLLSAGTEVGGDLDETRCLRQVN